MPRLTPPAADPSADGSGPAPAEPAPPPMLLTANDLAAQLRVSHATLDRLRAAGKLPKPLRLGSLPRWPRAEVESWIAAGMPDARAWEAQRRQR